MPDPKDPPVEEEEDWLDQDDLGGDKPDEDEDQAYEDALDEALEETFPASDPIAPGLPGFDDD
jgi:hypothetical protein